MSNFFKIFLLVMIQQILFLFVFGLAVIMNSDGIFFIPVILLISYLVIYFNYLKNICIKIKIDKKKFNTYYFISWIIIGILINYLLFTESWVWHLLPISGGMFSGLEYILVPVLFIGYLIVWILINIILRISNKL